MEEVEEDGVEPDERIHHKHKIVRLKLIHGREMALLIDVKEHTQDFTEGIQKDVYENAAIECFKIILKAFFNKICLEPSFFLAEFEEHVDVEAGGDEELIGEEGEYLKSNNSQ